MVVNGSSGERYTLNKKVRRTCRNYTEYPVMGSGVYVARIFDGSQRRPAVEREVRAAADSGSNYDDERPLNALYKHNKFVGFLYQGEIAPPVSPADNTGDYGSDYRRAGNSRGDAGLFIIGIQIAAAVIGAAVGWFIVYPLYAANINESRAEFSTVVQMLADLNYKGIPAIIVGIALQIFVFIKIREYSDSLVIMAAAGVASNITGTVLFTSLLTLIVYLVQGAISFIMRYLALIVILVVGFMWLKKKFFR